MYLLRQNFGHIPRIGIVWSYGYSIFNFLRKLHTVFYSICTILYPTNSAQKFTFSIAHAVHFLRILTNSHYFLFFLVVPIQMDVTQNQQRFGQSFIWDFSVNRNFVLFFFFPQWGLFSVLPKLCSGICILHKV